MGDEGECKDGRLDGEGMCVEEIRLTTDDGTKNNGMFTYDFGSLKDGLGHDLFSNSGTWADRYAHVSTKIVAKEHTLTTACGAGGFYLKSNPSSLTTNGETLCAASSAEDVSA